MKFSRKIFLFVLLPFSIFFSACEPTAEADYSAPGMEKQVENPQPSSSTTSNSSGNSNQYTVLSSQGRTVGTIDMTGGKPRIIMDDYERTSQMKNGKNKYFSENGSMMAEIKYKTGGFKLRTESGILRWKIKHSNEKIKVSDNEENENPYEIKPKEAGRVKLKRNEVELGSARMREAEGKIEVEGYGEIPRSYSIATDKFSMAWAVLLIDEIGIHEQLIIIAELIKAGF